MKRGRLVTRAIPLVIGIGLFLGGCAGYAYDGYVGDPPYGSDGLDYGGWGDWHNGRDHGQWDQGHWGHGDGGHVFAHGGFGEHGGFGGHGAGGHGGEGGHGGGGHR